MGVLGRYNELSSNKQPNNGKQQEKLEQLYLFSSQN